MVPASHGNRSGETESAITRLIIASVQAAGELVPNGFSKL